MVTLYELLDQFPENETLKYYASETKESWSNNKYYLGGQVPLSGDQVITEKHINEVKKKNSVRCMPCNSWENASVQESDYHWNEFQRLLSIFRAGK